MNCETGSNQAASKSRGRRRCPLAQRSAQGFSPLLLLGASLWFALAPPACAADALVWRADRNAVDARLENWPLSRVLQSISTATGWEVYVEPNAERPVSVKFKGLDPAAALRRLLEGLNFALVPETNRAPRLFVYRTSVGDATELVPGLKAKSAKPTSRVIPNELLVTLKPGAKESIADLARRLGAKITGSIDGLNTYRLQFDDAAAAQTARDTLSQDPSVASVENNISLGQPELPAPVSLSSASAPLPKLNAKAGAAGVVIGLVDTAIQPKGTGLDGFLLPTVSVAGQSDPPNNQPTHGTAMAETMLQSLSLNDAATGATSVRILPVDVYGGNPTTSTFDVANGIYSAVQGGATLINLSLGGTTDSPLLHQVIQSATQQGALFFAAAGNDPTTTPTYPAAYPEVISVTAGNQSGLAPYANRGDFVDVVAPGTSIINFNNTDYMVTGTSTSTADVTGLAAALSDQTGKSPAQVRAQILSQLSIAPYRKP
ncbi:MAG: S8 family serine peptidase [Verrucomicrobia bacterium]|nr:S8 family serine peptidase [Verrucomicrobiota bacterium]